MKRYLNLIDLTNRKSCFLLGPRATGKTYAINEQFRDQPHLLINLLRAKERLSLEQDPSSLADLVRGSEHTVVIIDEIQKVPALLDEVHHLIEAKKIKFLLTGSGARKLKANQANLLAGRASQAHFFPLTYQEIFHAQGSFDLDRYLMFGGLPAVWLSDQPRLDLDDYVNLYLEQEIQIEANIRRLAAFNRFLEISAIRSGEIINFTKVANDAQLPISTVRDYYQILEDTLLGFSLLPWQFSKRKAVQTAKFYFFDTGVRNAILSLTNLDRNSNNYGSSFEHFMLMEIRAYISYSKLKIKPYFWRTSHGMEVDCILGPIALEFKAAKKVSAHDEKNLVKINEEAKWEKRIIVSQDEAIRTRANGIEHWHWQYFFENLWSGKLS